MIHNASPFAYFRPRVTKYLCDLVCTIPQSRIIFKNQETVFRIRYMIHTRSTIYGIVEVPMGNKVRQYREYHGVSQQWLARKAKCGRTTIYEIERGGRLPNVVTAIRIARALRTTVEKLWEDEL